MKCIATLKSIDAIAGVLNDMTNHSQVSLLQSHAEEPPLLADAHNSHLVFLRLHANRRRRTAEDVEREECQDWGKIEAKDRRDDSAEQVEVGVGDRKDGLEGADALSLGEPAEQNPGGDDVIENLEEVREATDEHLLGDSVPRDRHGERGAAAADGHGTAATTTAHAATTGEGNSLGCRCPAGVGAGHGAQGCVCGGLADKRRGKDDGGIGSRDEKGRHRDDGNEKAVCGLERRHLGLYSRTTIQ